MTKRSWRYRSIRVLPLGLVAGLLSLAPTTGSASTWTVSQVDNSANVGKFASLAADGNKKLHVSYFDTAGALRYATNKSGSWASQQLVASGVVSAGTSLALDTNGYPQVNFYLNAATSNRGIRNVSYNGSSWTTNGISGSFQPLSDWETSIVNRGGYTSMLYVKSAGGANYTLSYSRNQTAGNYSAWSTPTTLDSTSGAGINNAAAIDSSGMVHVVGYNTLSTSFSYYTNASGSWTTTPLTTANEVIGKWCTLTANGNDLHLAYLATTASPASYRIKYRFKPAGGTWQSEVDVADAAAYGGYPSIAVDGAGNPHISFYYSAAAGSGKLRYATNMAGSWTAEDVDTSAVNAGSYSSIAIDSDQTVSIAYYDTVNSALKVASRKALLVNTSAINFGSIDRGFQSADSSMTITNNTLAPAVLGTLALSGTNAGDFGVDSDSCSGAQLPAQGSCTVAVHFAPPGSAPRSSARSATASVAASPYPAASSALSGTTSAKFLLTASASNGGSISPTQAAVSPGGSQTFTVTASANFSIGSVKADGVTPLTAPYTLANVSADHSVQASLVSPIRVFDTSIYYGSLQAAFETVNPGWRIQTQASIPSGDLTIDRDVAVTLSGGYDSTFSTQSANTSMSGNIEVDTGTLTVENLIMQ